MKFLILNELDNVGVASDSVQTGQKISLPGVESMIINQDVPASHKIAICDIDEGEAVIRYGESIGRAAEKIPRGSWVHTHNLIPPDGLATNTGVAVETSIITLDGPDTFMGYTRPSGPAGIRNHLLILPTVSCANGVVRAVGREFPDAVVIEHTGGCGRGGSDNDRTQRVLTGLGTHPNVSAAIVIGLGCEFIQSREIADANEKSGRPVKFLSIQEEGGTGKTTRMAIASCYEMMKEIKKQERSPQPVSDLMIGLECGGSDAVSGVTANPTVGLISDWLVSKNATTILSEITEMIGADHLMSARCCNKETARDLEKTIDKNRRLAAEMLGDMAHVAISPGNQDGGLSTIMEKSLGCITKGGISPVQEVVAFGQRPRQRGLIIMDTPGYDLESISGKAAGGCQAMLFTTGRCTPVGNSLSPTIKIASNTRLWETMEEDLDFNCGDIISGDTKMEDSAQSLLGLLVEIANGKQCKSEINKQTMFALSFTTEAL